MPKVRIDLEKDVSPEQAEEMLFKAFESQRNGEIHQEKFMDPAMTHLVDQMDEMHKKQYQEMLEEINQVLDEEYRPNGDI